MLSRFVFGITRRVLRTNFLVVSSRSTSDGDHTRSKAKEKAAEDLKTRREQRWLDTVASDSEAIIKSEQKDVKDFHQLQQKTIHVIEQKDAKGHLHQHDVGRRDTPAERQGS